MNYAVRLHNKGNSRSVFPTASAVLECFDKPPDSKESGGCFVLQG